MHKKIFLLTFAAISVSASAWAEGSGNAFRGKAYAGAMCASCHAVEAGDFSSPDPTAAPFQEAVLEAKTGEEFLSWFNAEHPQVSGPTPKPDQAADILAHMASLKTE